MIFHFSPNRNIFIPAIFNQTYLSFSVEWLIQTLRTFFTTSKCFASAVSLEKTQEANGVILETGLMYIWNRIPLNKQLRKKITHTHFLNRSGSLVVSAVSCSLEYHHIRSHVFSISCKGITKCHFSSTKSNVSVNLFL